MKYQIIQKKEEFVAIRSLLHIAITQQAAYHDKYISIMVRDAKEMCLNQAYRYRANKKVYHCSSFLCRHNRDLLQRLDPDAMGVAEYQMLLDFFESL